ncbi:MAG: hypothetical protein LW875_06265 [Proteobacteria bacterium]|jgi:hypothetical protein|nr:hypothetical protein [Pseudomonadota bacterium]
MLMIKSLAHNLLLTLLVTLTGVEAFAQFSPLDINPLKVTNRAQCAIDSDFPTQSVFSIIDGFNSGRLSHALAKNTGEDPALMTSEAMTDFRLSVAGLQMQIAQMLIKGELPLLPHNTSEEEKLIPQRYQRAVINCRSEVFCEEMKNYVSEIWKQSALTKDARSKSLAQVDNFSTQAFMPNTLGARVNCLLLKKFSPLQSHLHGTELNAAGLQNLAEAVINQTTHVASCSDTSSEIDSRNTALQIDIRANPETWNKVGFDFWNSMKIYFSWAWRNSEELKKWSPKYYRLFRSLDIEESLLLIPNGCKSIQPPKCDSETLSLNAIRELAKNNNQANEFDDLVGRGPEKELISKGARSVNDDFLGTLSYEKASEWVANFRKNFIEQRWMMRNKIFNGSHHLTLLSTTYSAEQLVSFARSYIFSTPATAALRDEAAYMCLEWQLSSDHRLDFLNTDIRRVSELDSMIRQKSPHGLSVENQVQFYQSLGAAMKPLCEELEIKQFFNASGYRTNWVGLENWAKEMTSKSIQVPEGMAFIPSIPATGAFLTFGNDQISLCVNPLECARKAFKAAVDLHAAAQYAEAFLQTKDQVSSPDVFNPYAELKACKVYDPWFVTNRTRKNFLADLANAALFGWNPLPIYMDLNWTAPRVTSFNQLVKEGKLKFDPNIEKSKMQKALLADFGPWLGTPCAVQISPAGETPFNFYAFHGVSLNYCKVNKGRDGVAERPGDIRTSEPKDASYCGGCSLNFVGVASSAAAQVDAASLNPLKFGVYLFRAVYRFVKGMKDKVNVPQSYTVDVNQVTETYLRLGKKIPESCVEPLSLGLSCFYDTCGSKTAQYLKETYGVTPQDLFVRKNDSSSGSADKVVSFKIPGCNLQYSLDVHCSGRQAKNFRVIPQSLFEPRSCRGRLNK